MMHGETQIKNIIELQFGSIEMLYLQGTDIDIDIDTFVNCNWVDTQWQ